MFAQVTSALHSDGVAAPGSVHAGRLRGLSRMGDGFPAGGPTSPRRPRPMMAHFVHSRPVHAVSGDEFLGCSPETPKATKTVEAQDVRRRVAPQIDGGTL